MVKPSCNARSMSGFPGPRILEHGPHPARGPSRIPPARSPAALAVNQRVARNLARRGDHLRLIDQANPSSARHLRTCCRTATISARSLRIGIRVRLIAWHAHTSSIRGERRAQQVHARSTFSAVRTPCSDSPSSTSVIATDGCIPTTTVSASSTRDIAAMLPSMRPMNESTISSDEMSISTPLAAVSAISFGEVFLQRQRQPVVHVHLDRDQEELAHLEDRNAFHALLRRSSARRCADALSPLRLSASRNASASVAFVVTSPRSTPRWTIVCAICGRMPLMMQSAPISRAAATVFSSAARPACPRSARR